MHTAKSPMEPELRHRLKAIPDTLERGLAERRQSVRLCLLRAPASGYALLMGAGFLEIADGIHPIRDWRRCGGYNADAPIHSRRLAAMCFPGALRGAQTESAVPEDVASPAVRTGMHGGGRTPGESPSDRTTDNDQGPR